MDITTVMLLSDHDRDAVNDYITIVIYKGACMPHRAGKKEEGYARVLHGAGRGFRRHGFGGIGVDGLAREAGVTSGAFYAHFRSKADAFRGVVTAGLRELADGVTELRKALGTRWRSEFVDFYLGPRAACDLTESCALQSLTAEVGRAGPDVRAAFESEFRRILDVMAPSGELSQRAEAIALLALLSGGVSLARAAPDRALAQEVLSAVRAAATGLEELARLRDPTDLRTDRGTED